MVKHDGDMPENTQVEDLDAFEEFESGPTPEPQAAPPHGGREEFATDLAFDSYEEPAAPAPAQAAAPAEPPVEDARSAADEFAESLLSLAPDVPVNLVAVIGKSATTVGELMKVRVGQVVDLGRPPSETVDVVVNGRLIARGELVDMDGSLGVRILKMVR